MHRPTRTSVPLLIAVGVALAATGAGVALAVRSGGYAPTATATGRVTVLAGSPLAEAGAAVARYCGSYGNVATQQGYAYTAVLPGGRTLTLADSLARTPGAQDRARITLAVDGPTGAYTWPPPHGSTPGAQADVASRSLGTVVLGPELLSADLDVRLVGPRGDTVPLRARFTCQPRVPPKRR